MLDLHRDMQDTGICRLGLRASPKLPLSPKCTTDQLLYNFINTTSILKIFELLEPIIYVL